MNESCCTYEWVMSHILMSHVTHMNESCCTYEWIMSHIWMSHVAHMNESYHTYERVMSHTWMSHVTHKDESCHTYENFMSLLKAISMRSPYICTCVCLCVCLRVCMSVCVYVSVSARKTSWNPVGVEPVHWKPEDINPGPLNWVQMRNARQFGANGTNQIKRCIRGRKPAAKKLFGRVRIYLY